MARIIIFGGHGKIALLAESMLAARGDTVSGVIRNPAHVQDVEGTGAQAIVADIEQLDTAELAELVEGYDAVVWSAGAGGGDPVRTRAVDRDAAIRTVDAAVAASVKRFVMVSYFGASRDHGIDPSDPFWHYAEAKVDADEHLRASELDWTVLGPSGLTLEPSNSRINVDAEESGRVSRESVAQVIAATLSDDTTIGRTIRFNDGDTPIAQAVRAE